MPRQAVAQPEHYLYDLNVADIAEVWRRGKRHLFVAAGPGCTLPP